MNKKIDTDITKKTPYDNHIFLIAEIGINHNGDLNIAKKLIDAAAEAGFDAVKFQKRTIGKVYSKVFLDSPRESPWGNTQRDQKTGLEFGKDEYKEIDIIKENVEPGSVLRVSDKTFTVKSSDGAVEVIDHDFKILPQVGEYL